MYSIHQLVSFKLLTLLNHMSSSFQKELQDVGITPGLYAALLVLYEKPGITQVEAAAIKRIDKATMGQMIDTLEKKKMVMREKLPNDRRAYSLFLTEQGRALVETKWPDKVKAEEEATQSLSEEERAIFLRLLDKTNEKMEGGY
ncbi:MAG TPA: MarR family transcriptional regulator [Bacillota bacterium]|nr:MarR family transcriptional regulator [Bacillota bacterium]